MITFKYEKIFPAALAGHTDTLRTVMRVFRRAKADVKYSAGYNPHMLLSFSPALAVGTESLCEYVAADMEWQEDIVSRLNAVCPPGLRFVKAFRADGKLSSKITSAKYLVTGENIGELSEGLCKDFVITYDDGKKQVTKEVGGKIYSAEKLGVDCFTITLACGNDNLRCDRVVRQLLTNAGIDADYSVKKIESYVDGVPADQYLSSIETKQPD